MEELLKEFPELEGVSAFQLIDALKGAGVKVTTITAAIKKVELSNKKNKRVSRSIETIIKF